VYTVALILQCCVCLSVICRRLYAMHTIVAKRCVLEQFKITIDSL